MIEFFDRTGAAVAFSPDEKSLFLWDGKAAAFIEDGKAFAYSGQFIGWISNGWLTDGNGRFLLYEYDAVGGPSKPQRQPKAVAGIRDKVPGKGAMQHAPVRPRIANEWSDNVFADLI